MEIVEGKYLYKNVNKSKKQKIFVYSIGIIAAVIILLSIQITFILKGFYSISPDESIHTIRAYQISKHLFHESFVWLPFYRLFVGFFLIFFHDLLIVPRIISMGFGILTLLGVTYLSHELFHDQIITIITAFLSSTFAPILILSVLPLMGIMFFFFIVGAFSFFVKWLNKKDLTSLIIACVFLFFSNTVRYEGWIYSFSFLLVLIYILFKENSINKNIKIIIIVSIIIFIFPAGWIISDYFETGKLFGFVSIVTGEYKSSKLLDSLGFNPLIQFFKLNFHSLNLLGLVPLILLGVKNKIIGRYCYLFFLSLAIMSLFALLGNAMPTHNYWRIACSWSILLLPFTSKLLTLFLNIRIPVKNVNVIFFIIITSIFTFFFFRQDIYLSSISYFTKSEMKTGIFLNRLINNNEILFRNSKILIISYDWHYTDIMVASQHPDLFIHVVKPAKDNKFFMIKKSISFNISTINKNSIKYLVLPYSLFQYYPVKNLRLLNIEKSDFWRVYKINF